MRCSAEKLIYFTLLASVSSYAPRNRPLTTKSGKNCATSIAREQKRLIKLNERKNLAGYYKRPSAALEQGGGFFIPGLEGYKLRLFTGSLILICLAINRFPGYEVEGSQLRSEVLGLLCGGIFFVQALAQKISENQRKEVGSVHEGTFLENEEFNAEKDSSIFVVKKYDPKLSETQRFSIKLSSSEAAKFELVSCIILNVAQVTTVLAVSTDGEVIGRFGLCDGQEGKKIALKNDKTIKKIQKSDPEMKLLPKMCTGGLLVQSEGEIGLFLSFVKGKKPNDLDTRWIRRYVEYLNIADNK
mmetsp:Transcript_16199/g.24025  ORF Transcript_16199/g.24025 Transcript_16199/m.24025 type:complete len:300 (-) Transcript_16199:19-918(-)